MPKVYSSEFARAISKETHMGILSNYSRYIQDPSLAIIAINTIEMYLDTVNVETLCDLIVSTAVECTSDLLQKILGAAEVKLYRLNDQYIYRYIEDCVHKHPADFIMGNFRILWEARFDKSNQSDIRQDSLNQLLSILRDSVRYNNSSQISRICILITEVIIEDINATDLQHILSITTLFKIACYDTSRELLGNLESLGYTISNFSSWSRMDIIAEYARGQRSLREVINLVDYMLDKSIGLSELYPLYAIAGSNVHKLEIVEYLMDINVRIPVCRELFYQMVSGSGRFNPNSIIFTLLNDMFDRD